MVQRTTLVHREERLFRQAKTTIILHSNRGSCADNAAAESFFGVLKRERIYRRQYRTRAEARTDIFDYIE